jgi:hypothetical protein
MRIVIVFAAASLLLSHRAGAQQQNPTPGSDLGFACFDSLAAPEFPKAALEAHVDGTVWTWTQLSPQGAVEKIDTQVVSAWSNGAKLLTPPVEAAIRAAKPKPQCFGNTVPIVFRYQLHGEATATPKATSRRENPNILWIESQPAIANKG